MRTERQAVCGAAHFTAGGTERWDRAGDVTDALRRAGSLRGESSRRNSGPDSAQRSGRRLYWRFGRAGTRRAPLRSEDGHYAYAFRAAALLTLSARSISLELKRGGGRGPLPRETAAPLATLLWAVLLTKRRAERSSLKRF